MGIISSRLYQDSADYEQIRQLARRCYADNQCVYATVGDLDWWRSAEPDPDMPGAQLWFDNDNDIVVGLGWPADDQIDILVDPRYPELTEEILAWGEARQPQSTPLGTEPRLYAVWSFTNDIQRRDLLRQRGYQRTESAFNLRSRSLALPLPDIRLPVGYDLRSLQGVEEIEPRVDVHRDAFAPSRMTLKRYRAAMGMPTYRLDLDLVAVAPDGSFAAFCIVWFDDVHQIGVFEPVGCHSAHRRRGLASAVMCEGMRRLIDLGAHTAYVISRAGADAEALYESLAFRVLDRDERWERTL